MYLGHFGLSEPPFADSSVPDFFYGGGNRGATLDALMYVLTHGEGAEGVSQVTGDAGSGKTMLCRSLIKRLPLQMQTIYFAKADFSREEFLRAIADALNFGVAESSTTPAQNGVAIDDLQLALTERYAVGGQVVLLVDEAHVMSAEVLEEALALCDLVATHRKLFQLVLFGQAELESTLVLPQIRKLKDRFTHHFILQPFSAKTAAEYLMCRMHAVGYRGPDIFSVDVAKLISRASGGLVRQLNILADKSLLAASVAGTPEVKASYVKAAIEDLGIKSRASGESWRNMRVFLGRRAVDTVAAFSTVAIVVLSVLGWQGIRSPSSEIPPLIASMPLDAKTPILVSASTPGPAYSAMDTAAPRNSASPSVSAVATVPSSIPPSLPVAASAPARREAVAEIAPSVESKPAAEAGQRGTARTRIAGVELTGNVLLEQRIEATTKTMNTTDKNFYTIQLFTTEHIQPDRMERFLARAKGQVDLSDLYVHRVSSGSQAKFIVTYGIYSSRDEARAAVAELPEKYLDSFHPELFSLSELH